MLDIDTTKITEVLLPDGWHSVEAGSFRITTTSRFVLGGDTPAHDGPPEMATWTNGRQRTYCPITSVLAMHSADSQQV